MDHDLNILIHDMDSSIYFPAPVPAPVGFADTNPVPVPGPGPVPALIPGLGLVPVAAPAAILAPAAVPVPAVIPAPAAMLAPAAILAPAAVPAPVAAAAPQQNLPSACQPFNKDWPVHNLGHMNIPCSECGALHWLAERLSGSSKINPKFGTCCFSGKVHIPRR